MQYTGSMYNYLKENFGRDKGEEWHGIEAEKEQISHDEGGYKTQLLIELLLLVSHQSKALRNPLFTYPIH